MDLAFISANCSDSSSWTVIPDNMGSDHLPIEICIILNSNFSSSKTFSHRINTKNVDWTKFSFLLNSISKENPISNFSSTDLQTKYDFYPDSIIKSIDQSRNSNKNINIGNNDIVNPIIVQNIESNNTVHNANSKFKKKKVVAPWWDDKCNLLVQDRKVFLKKFLDNRSLDNWILFKKINAKTKRELKKIKTEKFREFAESLNKDASLSYVWNVVKKFKHSVLCTDNQFKIDINFINSSNNFISEFCKPVPFFCYPPSKDVISNSSPSSLNNSYLNSPFSFFELKSAIKSLKNKTTPGLD